MPHNYAGPEARQWLQTNGQYAPLAANRFHSKKEALAFIDALYAAGARRVFIPRQDITDDEVERRQGGPYADAVVAEFDPNNCAEIVRIFQREVDREGFDDVLTGADGWIYMWWD